MTAVQSALWFDRSVKLPIVPFLYLHWKSSFLLTAPCSPTIEMECIVAFSWLHFQCFYIIEWRSSTINRAHCYITVERVVKRKPYILRYIHIPDMTYVVLCFMQQLNAHRCAFWPFIKAKHMYSYGDGSQNWSLAEHMSLTFLEAHIYFNNSHTSLNFISKWRASFFMTPNYFHRDGLVIFRHLFYRQNLLNVCRWHLLWQIQCHNWLNVSKYINISLTVAHKEPKTYS